MLLEADDADYDGRSALHVAASEGQLTVIAFLLELGAAVNAKDRFGHTPLQDVVKHAHVDVARLLRERRRARL